MSKVPLSSAAYKVQLAAIDIGATSTRLLVAEVDQNSEIKVIDRLVHPIALGLETFRHGLIRPQTVKALSQVLNNFSQVVQEYNVTKCKIVGTSALREASNCDIVVDRIFHECGINIEVLDSVEESRLIYQVLFPFIKDNLIGKNPSTTAVFDVGGGSTEIMVLKDDNIMLSGSKRLGLARLFYSQQADPAHETFAILDNRITNSSNSIYDLIRNFSINRCVVTNSMLSRICNSTKVKTRKLKGGVSVSIKHLENLLEICQTMSDEEIGRYFEVAQDDAELVYHGLLICKNLLDITKCKTLFVPEVAFLKALIVDTYTEFLGKDPLTLFKDQIIGSITGITDRYDVDRKHAQKVRLISMLLFDSLSNLFDLNERDRLYLELAAILHDIGRFINDRDHHKHGAYLLQWTEIAGLNYEERNIVALIVRYHRKGRPREEHEVFANLSVKDQMRIRKLSSILRIADALDRRHNSHIRKVSVTVTENELQLNVDARGEIDVENAALTDKGAFFEELTGLKIIIRKNKV